MIRMSDIITTCCQIEVQDDATALPLFNRLLAGENSEVLWDAYVGAQKIV